MPFEACRLLSMIHMLRADPTIWAGLDLVERA